MGADSIHIQPYCVPANQRMGGKQRWESSLLKPGAKIEGDSTVKSLKLANETTVTDYYYVSVIPVDVLKWLIPTQWSTNPYFRQLDELEGIPVINIQLWFDRKLKSIDGLCFSRSPLLSV